MKDRLISFDRVCEYAESLGLEELATHGDYHGMYVCLARAICKDQDIDAVEVVRCRDCVKRDTEGCPMRFWDEYDDGYTDNTKDDGFCNRGELHHGA